MGLKALKVPPKIEVAQLLPLHQSASIFYKSTLRLLMAANCIFSISSLLSRCSFLTAALSFQRLSTP
jgi:hypothetical protein